MTSRIFKSIVTVAALVLCSSLLFVMGVLTAVGKARGTKATARLVRELVDAHEQIDLRYPVHFASAFNPEGVKMLREFFPEVPADAPELTVGCIVGTHTGPGVFAISFISSK